MACSRDTEVILVKTDRSSGRGSIITRWWGQDDWTKASTCSLWSPWFKNEQREQPVRTNSAVPFAPSLLRVTYPSGRSGLIRDPSGRHNLALSRCIIYLPHVISLPFLSRSWLQLAEQGAGYVCTVAWAPLVSGGPVGACSDTERRSKWQWQLGFSLVALLAFPYQRWALFAISVKTRFWSGWPSQLFGVPRLGTFINQCRSYVVASSEKQQPSEFRRLLPLSCPLSWTWSEPIFTQTPPVSFLLPN